MIQRPHRVGIAVFGLLLTSLFLLAGLILRSTGGTQPDLVFTALPSAVQPAARTVEPGPSRSGSRFQVSPAWAARIAAAAGIPVPAVQAYGDVELLLNTEQPGCHLSWNTLAGIGWVESQHGTIGGRTLLLDGLSSTPVIGPALNGTGYAAIRATPMSTAWHGDPVWEHAVGPLQFIASTWQRWGADANGDGTADPLNIDDAALAAGRYLCADGHDLATATGWSGAIGSYNHDQSYVTAVLAAANTYAQRTARVR